MDLLLRAASAATIAVFCVGAVAVANADPQAPVEGRWTAKDRPLVLDIVRCGAGWCGVEITAAGACGNTVLRFAVTEPESKAARLRGRLELAAEARPYAVEVAFFTPAAGGPAELLINGHAGDTFEAWRRTFAFRELLASSGPAKCQANPKLS